MECGPRTGGSPPPGLVSQHTAEKRRGGIVHGSRLHPKRAFRKNVPCQSHIKAEALFIQPAADDECPTRRDIGRSTFEELGFIVVVEELEDVEDCHVSAMLRQALAGVAVAQGDVGIASLCDELSPACDLGCVIVKPREALCPSPLAQIHREQAAAAADIEQRQRARFEFPENSVIQRIGLQFGGNVMPQPEAAAQRGDVAGDSGGLRHREVELDLAAGSSPAGSGSATEARSRRKGGCALP